MGDVIDINAFKEGDEVEVDADALNHQIVQSNLQLMRQLSMIGQQPNTTFFLQATVETLLDVLFSEPEDLKRFHQACEITINQKLHALLKHEQPEGQ